jgi:hypothetical protein
MKREKTRQQTKTGEMRIIFFMHLFVTLSLLLVSVVARGEVTVSATVDRNALNPGDSLTLTVSIDANEEVSMGQPTLPALTDFEVLNEWTAQSQQATMVSTPQGPQFKRVYSTKYNFLLQPKRQGDLKIGSVEVVVDGRTHHSKVVSIKVAPGAGMQTRPRQAPSGGGRGGIAPPPGFDDDDDDLFSQLLRRQMAPPSGSRSLPVNPNDAFFIQVETDKTEVYAGEQVTVSFYLYTRGLLRDFDTLKYPSLKGFWKEDIEIATHLNFEQEIVNGIPYKKAMLASYALFPIKEGTVTVDPYQAKCSVITGDAFGFGLGKTYTYTKASQPVKITVKPIPVADRPADFSGAVGEFQVSAKIEDKNIVEGQPLTLKIRFEGRGNAKLIEMPPFQAPEGVELYDTQDEARFFRTGMSYKEFRVLLVPRREGAFTIPGVSAAVFEPAKSQYVKKSTDPITIHVGKGVAGKSKSLNMNDTNNVADEGVGKLSSEPRLLTEYREPLRLGGVTRALFWLVVFTVIVAALVWRARAELGWGQKKKDLMRLLKTRLKRVEACADKGDWRGVGTEMTNTVYFVLGAISGEGGAHLELEKLLLKAPPSVRRELAGPVAKQMEVFQILTFAPENVVGTLKDPGQLTRAISEMENLLAKAVALGLSSEQSDESSTGPTAS